MNQQNHRKIIEVDAQIQQKTIEILKQNQIRYKDDLDKQRQVRNAMNAYGNMTAEEKRMNKQDLTAYKTYEQTNHAMMPGGKASSELINKVDSPSAKRSPKKTIDEKVEQNVSLLQKYGAAHLGASVGTLEPKIYLG